MIAPVTIEPVIAAKDAVGSRSWGPTLGLAFVICLGPSVLWGCHAWSSHPTSVTTCGCGDPALFTWLLEWPAYALAHGHNLSNSSAMFHPGGIDLFSNTIVLAIGTPLAAVTWQFGPVATSNVASTLTAALGGKPLRRCPSWSSAWTTSPSADTTRCVLASAGVSS